MAIERLGTDYGGWPVPTESLHSGAVCFAVGAGEDISFELELIRRFDCSVFVFDPTPRAIEHVRRVREGVLDRRPAAINNDETQRYPAIDPTQFASRFHFEPWGIYDRDGVQRFYEPTDTAHVSHSIENMQSTDSYFEAECKSVRSAMAALGQDHIDVLKLNVEGAENAILRRMIHDGIYPEVLSVGFESASEMYRVGETWCVLARLLAKGYRLESRTGWSLLMARRFAIRPRQLPEWLRLGARSAKDVLRGLSR
jgi:FkbM family methyltransferase